MGPCRPAEPCTIPQNVIEPLCTNTCNEWVNLSSPSAAYMNWVNIGSDNCWSPICAEPLSKPCWIVVNCTLRKNNLQWNFNQHTKLLTHENAFENIVCEKTVILSRGRWVDIATIDGLRRLFYGAFQYSFLWASQNYGRLVPLGYFVSWMILTHDGIT